MHSFNAVILCRSFTGRRFIGGRVTDGPSVGTFFSPCQPVMGQIYNYVGLSGWWQSCCCKNVQKADWQLSQCLCVCHARTGNSHSLIIPQASVVLRSCHGNWWTTDEALLYESHRAFCKYPICVACSYSVLNDLLNYCCLSFSWMKQHSWSAFLSVHKVCHAKSFEGAPVVCVVAILGGWALWWLLGMGQVEEKEQKLPLVCVFVFCPLELSRSSL